MGSWVRPAWRGCSVVPIGGRAPIRLRGMLITAINTPLKQRDLEATARAGALLSGAGLVGVLTAGPARLCLLPMGGGEGRVVDVAVESPQDLALLSKDVAVVRAGGGRSPVGPRRPRLTARGRGRSAATRAPST